MDRSEPVLEAVLVPVLGIVAELGGLPKLFDIVNPFLREQEVRFPARIPAELNANFNARFEDLRMHFVEGGMKSIPVAEMDPNFPSSAVSTIPLLICSNFAPGSEPLLKLCDEPFEQVGLELMTCGVQIIPPGVDVPLHREAYAGYFDYYLVLAGSPLATMVVGRSNYQLLTKSSLLFDPTVMRSISNRSKQPVHILCCEFRRPLHELGALVNSVVMKVLAVSQPVMRACEIAWTKRG